MAATFRHFAINADNVQRAKRFYEGVFGWRFDPWGPPNFYQVKNAGAGLFGALQERRELVPGVRMAGYEASIGVDDLKATIAAVEAGGGKIGRTHLLRRPGRQPGRGHAVRARRV